MDPKITTTIITAGVTVSGWIILNYLNKKKENRTKLLQLKLDHISRQIEELYGPLFNLVNQINTFYYAKDNIQNQLNNGQNEIESFVREKFFYRLHKEVLEILKSKYHLIENNEMPESFQRYLSHSLHEILQIDIWNNLQISTSKVKGVQYPDEFDVDIKKKLDELKKQYNELIKQLDKK